MSEIGEAAFYGCSNLTEIFISEKIITVEDTAFYDCKNLSDVYYGGTKAEWDSIKIGNGNEPLINATIHFNSVTPTIAVTGISLNETAKTLLVGDTFTLISAIKPRDASNTNLSWRSDRPEVADVDSNGIVTALSPGDAVITVITKDGGYTASCTVTVRSNEVHEHSLYKVEASEATCDHEGNSEYWACSGCGKYYSDEAGTKEIGKDSWIIPRITNHSYGEWKTTKEPTAAATGTKERVCSVCGNVETEVIEKLYEPSATEPDQIEDYVKRLYVEILEREADDSGLAEWVSVLENGETDLASVIKGFVLSREFQNRPLENEAYVVALYHIVFNREPDEEGLKTWVNVLENGCTRKKVLAGFINSKEMNNLADSLGVLAGTYKSDEVLDRNSGVTSFVARLYKVCLGRKYDEDGLGAWVTILLDGASSASSVARKFLMSPEMDAKNLSDDHFLTVCYDALFDREPDENGFSAWIEVLKTSNRRKVIDGFTGSQEFANLCKRFGVKQ